MVDVGLVTPYRIDNYGTKLQAYAMQELVAKMGFRSEIIDYYPKYDKRLHILIKKVFHKLLHRSDRKKNEFNNENIMLRHSAIQKFDVFYKKSKKIMGYSHLRSASKDYRYFICGSDQIWEPGNMITDYYNLNFVNNKLRISYAASFGIDQIPAKYTASYRHFLSRIDHISVRESSGVDIVRSIIGREAVQVLDPTIAVGVDVWDELCRKQKFSHHEEEYIFCYFLGDNKSHREMAEKLSERTGLKLISLPHMKQYVEEDEKMSGEKLYDVTPLDFLQYIKYAKYICTDSFHGTVFSILFQKKFYTFNRFDSDNVHSTNTRIQSLLTITGLIDRLTERFDEIEKSYSAEIDYHSVQTLLNKEIEKSKKFLFDSLK